MRSWTSFWEMLPLPVVESCPTSMLYCCPRRAACPRRKNPANPKIIRGWILIMMLCGMSCCGVLWCDAMQWFRNVIALLGYCISVQVSISNDGKREKDKIDESYCSVSSNICNRLRSNKLCMCRTLRVHNFNLNVYQPTFLIVHIEYTWLLLLRF